MALQSSKKVTNKWNVGSQCQVYCDDERKWIEGEIVDTFIYRKQQWIRVRYGARIKDLRSNSPLCVPHAAERESRVIDPNIERIQQQLDDLSQTQQAGHTSIRDHFFPQLSQSAFDLKNRMYIFNI